jgi:hypothetical protein
MFLISQKNVLDCQYEQNKDLSHCAKPILLQDLMKSSSKRTK